MYYINQRHLFQVYFTESAMRVNQSCANLALLFAPVIFVLATASELKTVLNVIQSILVISTSVISKNRLSRRKNLVLVITQKSKIRL